MEWKNAMMVSMLMAMTFVACKGDDAFGAPAPNGSAPNAGKPPAAVTGGGTAPLADSPTGSATVGRRGLVANEEWAATCNDIPADGSCGGAVFTDPAKKDAAVEFIKKACKTGTMAPCPAAGVVATCRITKNLVMYLYDHGGKSYDAASAKAACAKQHGRIVD